MALALDTLLPTPYGWTSVHDLKPETVLIDELGYPCKIRELSEPYVTDTFDLSAGWSMKRSPEVPAITISDNQQLTTIGARRFEYMNNAVKMSATTTMTEEMKVMPDNWPVWSHGDIPRTAKVGRKATRRAQDVTAVEISESIRYFRRRKGGSYILNHHIPIMFPMQVMKRDLKIPPYVVGVMLNYAVGSTVRVTNNTYEYYKNQFNMRGVRLDHPTNEFIKQRPFKHVLCETYMGGALEDYRFNKKHIPADYLRGSMEQRMELLSGLLDQHTPRFERGKDRRDTSLLLETETLAFQVLELVRSLGYPAFIRRRSETGYWFVMWYPAANPYIMPLLKTRYGIISERVGSGLERFIWKIYSCDRSGQQAVRDISVDSPHGLYTVSELFLPMKGD